MKVAIGHVLQDGPYGGGNSFVSNLAAALTAAGHEVVFDLASDDIDIIVMTDPRSRSPNVAFAAGKILRYQSRRNPKAIVIHRINECDERKDTRRMNGRLRLANHCADHTVYVGSWLRDLPLRRARKPAPEGVILNGANAQLYNADGHVPWNGHEPLKLVTHHWGYHWRKGFDVYQRLDQMLATPTWRDRFTFTYIGNLPAGFRFGNARYMPPMSGEPLAAALRTHHAYVTASINEPGSNHQNEGAMCGLPLLYRDSGCLPEYCDGFGVLFHDDRIEPALESMLENYDNYAARIAAYPYRADRMTREYIELFERLLDKREEIIARRRGRPFNQTLLNQIPW
jgi:hypothetical protein